MGEMYAGFGKSTLNSTAEVVKEIHIPLPADDEKASFVRLELRKSLSLPMLNVAAMAKVTDGVFQWVRITMGPVGVGPTRAFEAEEWLKGKALTPENMAEAGRLALHNAKPRSNPLRGSKKYREHALPILVRRALEGIAKQMGLLHFDNSLYTLMMIDRREFMEKLNMTINGKAISVDVDPGIRLVDFLRDNLFLTGTKIGCGKGECGACTVIMNGKAVTSCIIPVMRAQGAVIETIEGLGKNGKLHPIQEEFINKGAIQCGFCTPGMIMSSKALLDENNAPTSDEVREALGGNICRCTGYVKIEEAVMAAADRMRKGE